MRRAKGRARAPERERVAPADPGAGNGRGFLLLLGLALLVRVLFWRAGPDAAWPYSVFFKGDALIWLEYAAALRAGIPFELGLPIHPPGTAYLVSWLWDGHGFATLRAAWCLLGAASVALFALAIARSFGATVALIAGAWMAASTGLLVLSSSPNAEAPYLLLVAGSFVLLEGLRERPRFAPVAAWAALQGLACLFRVEHAAFVAMLLPVLALGWWRSLRTLRPLAVALLALLVPLLPWHARAWSGIARFNEVEPEQGAAARIESLPGLGWDEAALARRTALPAFARSTAAAFVAATVIQRGGHQVSASDFGVLDEAFGYVPAPLSRFPFVSSYGPLNFALANNAGATGGFSPALLEDPPPLRGGAERFPAVLVAGLPPPQLALVYPPHLRLFNEGYAVGRSWIAGHPGAFLRLCGRKLAAFWGGAAMGVTGYGFPLGASGTRKAVDLVAPGPGALVTAWRLLMVLLCGAGIVAGLRPALLPWLLFLLSKLVTTVLFFGYARLGATVVPVVALLIGLALDRFVLARLPRLRERAAVLALATAAILAGAEAVRGVQGVRVRIDGREVISGDPFPSDVHRDQVVEIGYGRSAPSGPGGR